MVIFNRIFTVNAHGSFGVIHLCRQLTSGKGLLHKVNAVIQDPVMGNDIGRVSGHEKGFDFRISCVKPAGQVSSVHGGHDHIGDQEIDPAGMGLCQSFGFARCGRGQDTLMNPLFCAVQSGSGRRYGPPAHNPPVPRLPFEGHPPDCQARPVPENQAPHRRPASSSRVAGG